MKKLKFTSNLLLIICLSICGSSICFAELVASDKKLIIELTNKKLSSDNLINKKQPRRKNNHVSLGKRLSPTRGLFSYLQSDLSRSIPLKEQLNSRIVKNIEFDSLVYPTELPNDPHFGQAWSLQNVGQSGGVVGADINATTAWDTITDSSETIIAIIDTGIDYYHEDLSSNIWVNSNEIPNNGIDDDNNGFVDDVNGYDFGDDDNNPIDEFGHGTQVAGIIAAKGNNALGIAGVTWSAKLMVLKYVNSTGLGWKSDLVAAIYYAIDMGADIINLSLGNNVYSPIESNAIKAAQDAGILVISSAGNNAESNESNPVYPASYKLDNIISVAATNNRDNLSSFSNYGVNSVDISAPGEDVVTTEINNQYSFSWSGTSAAAPYVAGAAALLKEQNQSRSALQLKRLIVSYSDPIDSLKNITLSGNRLNVASLVTCPANNIKILKDAPDSNFVGFTGELLVARIHVHDCGNAVDNADIRIEFDNGENDLILNDAGIDGDELPGDGIYSTEWRPVYSGEVTLLIDVTQENLGNEQIVVNGNINLVPTYRAYSISNSWIDTSLGVPMNSGDSVSITFPFQFYEDNFDELVIFRNGVLQLSQGASESVPPGEEIENPIVTSLFELPGNSFPASDQPNSFIAPFWEDNATIDSASIRVLPEGEAPNRQITVEWHDVKHSSDNTVFNYQATLYESSEQIVFRYKNVLSDNMDFSQGASAVVGIENSKGLRGTFYSVYTPQINNDLSLAFDFSEAPIPDSIAPVTISLYGGGIYNTPLSLTLLCSDDLSGCAATYYTLDGSTPNTTSLLYDGPITITENTLLSYFSIDNAGNEEVIQAQTYVIDSLPPTTATSHAAGNYDATFSVTLTCSDENSGCSNIYYSLDNSEPDSNSPRFTAPISILSTSRLNVRAHDLAGNWETTQSFDYTITLPVEDVVPPSTTASTSSGTFALPLDITLLCNDNLSGCASTYYTLDGSTPNTTSLLYDGPITITENTLLSYFSIDNAGNAQVIQIQNYTVDSIAPISTISHTPGTYDAPLVIVINCLDENSGCSKIFYTLDGTLPSNKSLTYINELTIKEDTIIRYFVSDSAGNLGDVETIEYFITAERTKNTKNNQDPEINKNSNNFSLGAVSTHSLIFLIFICVIRLIHLRVATVLISEKRTPNIQSLLGNLFASS